MSPTKKKQGFSAEEKAAMRARAKELRANESGEKAVKAALAKMTPSEVAQLVKHKLARRYDGDSPRLGGPQEPPGPNDT
jgi:hypothetical protein